MMYEYKFVRIENVNKVTADFQECRTEIEKNAAEGWRLVQVVMLPNDKLGVYRPNALEIIFEREK